MNKYIQIILPLILIPGLVLGQATNVDSLKTLLDGSALSKVEKLQVMLDLAAAHRHINTDLQQDYGEKALDLAVLLDNQAGMGKAKLHIGVAQRRQAEFSHAIDNLLASAVIAQEVGDKELLASAYVNLGEIYRALDDNLKAIDYCLKSLKLNEEIDFPRGIAGSSNNLAIIYRERGEYDKALKYYHHALEVGRGISDNEIIAMTLHNIGEVLNHQSKYDAALDYYDQSLKVCEEMGISFGIALNLATTAETMSDMGDNKQSTSILLAAISQFEQLKNVQKVAINRALIAEIYLKSGNLDSATYHSRLGGGIADDINLYELKMRFAKIDAEIAERQGNTQQALQLIREYGVFLDSLYKQEKTAEIEKLHILFDMEQKETENELLRQEASIHSNKLMANRYLIISITLGLIMTAGIAIFFLKSYIKKRRVNLEIESINRKLEDLLQERTRKIEEQDQRLNEFAWYNAHSVRAPLVRILGLVDLIETSDGLSTNEIKSILEHINNSAKELDDVIIKLNDLLKDKGIDPIV